MIYLLIFISDSLLRCGRVNKVQVLAVFSSDEELRGLEISLEDLTNQNDDCGEVTRDTDELTNSVK